MKSCLKAFQLKSLNLKYQSFFILLGLLFPSLNLSGQFTYERCGADWLEEQSLERNPDIATQMAEVEAFTANWIEENARRSSTREVITIPVVVHVLYHESSQNISELQVLSQIGILNEDYRLRNENLSFIPDVFRPLAADIGLEFCLASVDPMGNLTDGITRTKTEFPCVGDFNSTNENGTPRLFYTILGGKDAWNPASYLNIWVAPTCNAFLGFGFNPGESADPREDGVVIDTRYFGNVCDDGRRHHLGRTTTHEIGHYFNLKHIWGKSGCDQIGDLVDDTPMQDNFNRGCPTHPKESCGSVDMFMNFMDYTDDACIAMFTIGQKNRMLAALNGPRSGLLSSRGCSFNNTPRPDLSITLFPNPTSDCLHIDYNANFSDLVDVYLFDISGKQHYYGQNNASNIRSVDVSQLAPSVYYLVITNGVTEVTKTVLVN